MSVKYLMALLLCVVMPLGNAAELSDLNDICAIFDDKRRWHRAAKKASEKWEVPVSTLMAIVHQESRFDGDAEPPEETNSSAKGFAQAKEETWEWYIEKSGNNGADRDNFKDSMDFIGWYSSVTHERNRVSLADTYSLYLAYHEGHGGFESNSWEEKEWLLDVARKVELQAMQYREQYLECD